MAAQYNEVDYGPLRTLIGIWQGDKGLDIAPERAGPEENPYYESLSVEPAGDVTNAESQQLVAVYYRQVVTKKASGKVFHDQCGYWIWDAAAGVVMQTLTIPRGVCVVADGHVVVEADRVKLDVTADSETGSGRIAESPFMQSQARTLSFTHRLTVCGDRLSYAETTMVDIYGKVYEHGDRNELTRSR